jgi:hypothetical protein
MAQFITINGKKYDINIIKLNLIWNKLTELPKEIGNLCESLSEDDIIFNYIYNNNIFFNFSNYFNH